jgi:hypothetical protein
MNKQIVSAEQIALRIRPRRGQKVPLDSDLSRLYGVTTGNLNKAVNRNRYRLPAVFVFQLTTAEAQNLIFQIGRSKGRGGRRHLPSPSGKPRREIGFHVREKAGRYRVSTRT